MSLRILVAVTHLVGAGHLVRAAAIGRALAAAGHRVTLVTGGRPSPLIPFAGLEVVQLPPVAAAPDDFSTLLDADGRPAGSDLLAARRTALLAAFAAARPHVVLTELFPFGRRALAAEFGALVDAAERRAPPPLLVASVRDVLVAPSKPGRAEAVNAQVARSYAAVLVHGDERLLPLDGSWPVDPALRGRLRYTGYVDGGEPEQLGPHHDEAAPRLGCEILVAGGSSDAALPLYRAARALADRSPGRNWRILLGRGVSDAERADLAADAPPGVTVESARPDIRALMRGAAVFVGQAGYNTAMDIVATGCRAVLVPFERGRETEQRVRAEALARHGRVQLLSEAELSPTSLAAAIQAAKVQPTPAPFEFAMDGARHSVALIEALARERRP